MQIAYLQLVKVVQGFVSNSFAMRLNQLGKNAYVVGESTTPSIKEHDLFIIISGSGSTEHLRL